MIGPQADKVQTQLVVGAIGVPSTASEYGFFRQYFGNYFGNYFGGSRS